MHLLIPLDVEVFFDKKQKQVRKLNTKQKKSYVSFIFSIIYFLLLLRKCSFNHFAFFILLLLSFG